MAVKSGANDYRAGDTKPDNPDTGDITLYVKSSNAAAPTVANSAAYMLDSAGTEQLLVPGVTSVSNADGTLTISPTTGAVVASRAALTGPITVAAGANATVIGASAADGSTLEVSGGALREKDGGTTNAKLANMGAATLKGSVAGGVPADLTPAQITTNFVVPDGSTLEISGGTVREKDGGTTNAKLANKTAPMALGRVTAGSGVIEDLTPTQVTASLVNSATSSTEGKIRQPFINVKDFGATGNGSTDDTTNIQAALTSMSAGGCLVFPAGTYIISSTLTLPASNFTLMGVDRGSCVIMGKTTFTTGDMITCQSGGDQVTIKGLWITMQSSTARTTGASININGCNDVLLEDLTIYFPYIGIQISGGGAKIYANNIDIKVPTALTTAANSAGILLDNGTTGDTYLGPHINLESASGAGKAAFGIRIVGTGYVQMTEIAATAADVGCDINPTAGKSVLNVFASKCLWDTCVTAGMRVNASTATSVIRQIRFTDSWAAGCTAGPGIITSGTAGGVLDDFAWVGGRVLSNNTHGIQHGFGTNVNILGNTIAGNSTAGSGVSDGINVATTIGGFIIDSNRICAVNTFASNQRYGVNIAAGAAASGFIIVDNDLTGNVTGAVSDSSTITAFQQKDIEGNLGHLIDGLQYSRTATVAFIANANTVVGGGTNNLPIPKNSLRPGSSLRVTIYGSATGTATASAFELHLGTAGTTADAKIFTASTTGAVGTSQFKAVIDLTFLTVGATTTQTGNLTVSQHLALGIVNAASEDVIGTFASAVTTADNYLTASILTAAAGSSGTVQNCIIEILN